VVGDWDADGKQDILVVRQGRHIASHPSRRDGESLKVKLPEAFGND
jgi:hypothetical protein